ncbi:hypothetical protein SAMN05443667_116120 [Flavobacterium gillisiae]|uniref:Uncharacterized protein n=1 Tax=Flavobacterium gillisiae TaxID=150146 RepID=A0A1H4G4L4_9FLAO|nr:hypothetical protein SAMN05443667_116120 [Flavobacterium gillisiae]
MFIYSLINKFGQSIAKDSFSQKYEAIKILNKLK